MPDKLYPVSETFFSFQGEGMHAGKSAHFIRLYGCPIKCPWCDSAETWKPELRPANLPYFSVPELLGEICNNNPDIVVITGGEPAIHDLAPLTDAIRGVDYPVHIETSGAFPLKGTFTWITVSPKWAKLPCPQTLMAADEIKLIVEDETSIQKWVEALNALRGKSPTSDIAAGRSIWLHPEWGQRENPVVLNSISEWVKDNGRPFKAGYQIHKLYGVR